MFPITMSLFRYVLLKEKNMLLTIEQESKRQRLAMPSPERLKKVRTGKSAGIVTY